MLPVRAGHRSVMPLGSRCRLLSASSRDPVAEFPPPPAFAPRFVRRVWAFSPHKPHVSSPGQRVAHGSGGGAGLQLQCCGRQPLPLPPAPSGDSPHLGLPPPALPGPGPGSAPRNPLPAAAASATCRRGRAQRAPVLPPCRRVPHRAGPLPSCRSCPVSAAASRFGGPGPSRRRRRVVLPPVAPAAPDPPGTVLPPLSAHCPSGACSVSSLAKGNRLCLLLPEQTGA